MRVLLDATAERRGGRDRGIGRYMAALRMANEALRNSVMDISVTMTSGRMAEFSALGRRSWNLLSREFDVFHAPTAYYAAPDLRRRACVVSILDLIPLDVPEHRRTGLKALVFHHLAARADVVLTLSRHAAMRIESRLGVAPEKIVVAPLPASTAFKPVGSVAPALPSPYVAVMLDLRTPDPRKRAHWLPMLAEGLRHQGIHIALVGGGTESARISGVHSLGRVSDADWAAVLRGAQALVYTSSYEGQGMPLLEAIACGCPVVTMGNTALPEVVGAAGLLVPEAEAVSDAGGVGAMVEAVRTLMDDSALRKALRDSCGHQAAQFTMSRFSDGVSAAYQGAQDSWARRR